MTVGEPSRQAADLVGDPGHVADDDVRLLALDGIEQVADAELHRVLQTERDGVLAGHTHRLGGEVDPITCPAPSLAATKDSTPLPQPTSITVSPGSISSASAMVRLVCVGWNTPSPSDTVKGPVRPFHSKMFGSARRGHHDHGAQVGGA